ncbi:MAG: hypothetical protein GXO10_06855 [Crenarchaeota archaeon]|nr:hypothetical protein [Thermoproteota archaeon]
MKIVKRNYEVFHILIRDDILFIYGRCNPIIEFSPKILKITCKVDKVYTVNDINIIRSLIGELLRDSGKVIRVCCLFSTNIIRKILGVSSEFIRKIPIQCEYFPYVSLGEIDIVRKIGILHIIDDVFIDRLLGKDSLSMRDRVFIIHYLLMLLGYNYDSSMVSLGRLIYEKYRARV